jgi:DNA adenine methylase
MPEPVLKWAGGKRQILREIQACLPPESNTSVYHEPFFGGGALFFKTWPHPNDSTINDINERLMNFYGIVRDHPKELIETLETFDGPEAGPDSSREYSDRSWKGKAIDQYYYQQRELFNRRPRGQGFNEVEEAALLMYLNRTCYRACPRNTHKLNPISWRLE